MTDIISAIDSATGCQSCGNPLGSSPSADFCSEFCQRAWHAKRISPAALATGNRVSVSVNAALAPSFAERVAEAAGSMRALARLLWEVENQSEGDAL